MSLRQRMALVWVPGQRAEKGRGVNEPGSPRIWFTLGICFIHTFGVGADEDGSDFIESDPCLSKRHRVWRRWDESAERLLVWEPV